MKKLTINIVLILTFFIIYFLQVDLFSWFKIAGVMPNIFIILVLFIGLFGGTILGTTYGVVFGILIDLFIGKKVGITAIMLGSIGILGGIFDKNFSKDSRITTMVMIVVATIVYEVGIYIINNLMFGSNIEPLYFGKILFFEIIYNTLITIILYPIMQINGDGIEREYKGNKILTRYF